MSFKTLSGRKKYRKARKKYLKRLQEINGTRLWCEYCGVKLTKAVNGRNIDSAITIDHYIPKSQLEENWNVDNFVVSCYRCNFDYGNCDSEEKKILYPLKKDD